MDRFEPRKSAGGVSSGVRVPRADPAEAGFGESSLVKTRSETASPDGCREAIRREDRSFSMTRANIYVLAMTVPIGAAFFVPYYLLWGGFGTGGWNLLGAVALFLGGVVIHELLHGITWMIAGDASPGSVKFGVQWKALTPYAHCTRPLEVSAYRWGAAVPGIVLGIVPGIAAIAIGSPGWLVFGFLFTLAAGGDALILWMLRDVPGGALVEDHPTRAGCYVLHVGGATAS